MRIPSIGLVSWFTDVLYTHTINSYIYIADGTCTVLNLFFFQVEANYRQPKSIIDDVKVYGK